LHLRNASAVFDDKFLLVSCRVVQFNFYLRSWLCELKFLVIEMSDKKPNDEKNKKTLEKLEDKLCKDKQLTNVGSKDLDPLATGSGGGGMIFDPLQNAKDQKPDARYDPPGPLTSFEPDKDHMQVPKSDPSSH